MNYTIGQRVRFVKTENMMLELFVGATAVITTYNTPCEGCGEIHTDRTATRCTRSSWTTGTSRSWYRRTTSSP